MFVLGRSFELLQTSLVVTNQHLPPFLSMIRSSDWDISYVLLNADEWRVVKADVKVKSS